MPIIVTVEPQLDVIFHISKRVPTAILSLVAFYQDIADNGCTHDSREVVQKEEQDTVVALHEFPAISVI